MDTLAADREKLKEIRALLKASDISDKGKTDCLGEFEVSGIQVPTFVRNCLELTLLVWRAKLFLRTRGF